MSIGTVATILALLQGKELPKAAEIHHGEVVRLYSRSYSRGGLYETVMVLTPNEAFYKTSEKQSMMILSPQQQEALAEILKGEPEGLRAQKRPNPMWPSSYDAQDEWMTYRVRRTENQWTNYEYGFPTEKCPLTKFLMDVRTQLSSPH